MLAMCSRVLGRVFAKRLSWWAEHLELLDENQAGFKKGKSTDDVVQIMVKMQKDMDACRKRKYVNEERMEDDEWPSAMLLGLEKVYPRVINRSLDVP